MRNLLTTAKIATASPPPTRAPPQIGEISIPQSETYLSGSEESRGRREPSTETEDSDEIRLIFPDLFPDDPPEEVIEPDFYASTGRIHRAVTRRKSQSSAVPLAIAETLKVGAVTKEPQVCLLTAQNQKVIAAIQQYPVLAEYPKVGAETKEPQVCLLTAQNQNATAAIQQYSVFGENLKVGAVTKEPQVCLLTEQHPNANTTIEHYPVLEFSKPMAFGRGGSRGPRGTPNQPRGYSRTPNPQPPAGPASTLPPTLYEIRRKILQHRTVLRNLAQCMEDNLVVAQTRTHKAALNKFEWLEIEHFARPGTSRHIQILYHRNALEQPGTFSEPDIRQAHIDALEHLERDPAERMYSQQSGLPSETGLFGRSMHTESEMPEPKKPEPEKRDVREESYDLLGLYAKKPEDIGKRLDWVDPRRLN
ncbi:hypothetical protein EDC01DRAFT_663283 [Geopyxis carbonaria]|nr:hypothetical protein EDC01DRAFT_663283 [Geopyxis carbonaria]